MLLKLARWLLAASEWLTDLDQRWNERDWPPSTDLPRINTSDRPFGLPDVPVREVDRLEPLPRDVLYRISTGGRPWRNVTQPKPQK